MEAQNLPKEGQDGLEDRAMESVGVPSESHDGSLHEETHDEMREAGEGSPSKATLAVQKRIKSLNRAHEREVRELHARIGDLESRMTQPTNASSDQMVNPYGVQAAPGNIDEHIHKAVSVALQQKELAERKAREAESAAHVGRQYQELQRHLDNMGDKYDDFHDVVMGPQTPFTPAMRDYAMTLPRQGAGSAGEVLYKLGKNPEELQRIAKLHPLDQASEMARLSQMLVSGGENKAQASRAPLGNIKNNPVMNNRMVTDQTPVSELRARMKAGWK